ncbi:MAG: hypothetical protein IKZ60_06830 [Bacteroidales bacterium]|nr:hypothetical protein [Bacteroidales bacterium]
MSIRTLLISCTIVLMSVAACSKSETGTEKEGVCIPSISAVYTDIEEAQTKNEITSLRWSVGWKAGDQIAVVNLSTGAKARYTVQPAYVGENHGCFDYTDGDAVGTGSIVAIYPYSAVSLSSGKNGSTGLYDLLVTVQNEVSYSASDNAAFSSNDIQITRILSSDELSNDISFYRVVTLVSVQSNISEEALKDKTVSSVVLSMASPSAGLAGTATVVFNEGIPSVAVNGGDATELKCNLTAAPILASIDQMMRFIPMFPFNRSEGIRIIMNADDYTVGFFRKGDKAYRANRHVTFQLFEGAYTEVFSQDEATFDRTWWYVSNEGGKNSPGSFGNGAETQYGSTAGKFIE